VSARRIDLHTHSTASDGTTPPAALVREARDAGLDVVALTDHDTTAGWDAAANALPRGMSLVRGAEISCVRDGISLHLLAYLFDPAEPGFAAARRALRDSRVGRAERMVALLRDDGVDVTWEQVQDLAGGTVGRPHVARALMAAGLVGSVDEAFTPDWIGHGGRYYARKLELDVLDAIAMVTAAGGVSVFAHPAANKRGRTVGEDVVREMAAAGLAGLEVDHLDHDEDERAGLRALAAELDLLTTGSSDFHGEHKVNRLGACTTSEASYSQIVERAGGVGVVTA
jgi:predicted metal-dependent phosphoesterase TrpH